MHPEIYRAMSDQRGQELRESAHRSRLARMAIRGRRHGRRHGRDLPDDDFVVPAVPDYVDGSFRTDQAVGQVASEAGQAPARHAA
jgi:hypothetical protein